MGLATSHRLSIYSDRGPRTHHRDRIYTRDPFVAVLSARTNANAEGVGPFELGLGTVETALTRCDPPFRSPDEVRNALGTACVRLMDRNAADPLFKVTVSAVVAWETARKGYIETLHAGGGHAFFVRAGTVTPISTAAHTASGEYLNVLGERVITEFHYNSTPWQPGDCLVLVSAGTKADAIPALIESAPSFAALAGHVGTQIMGEHGISVIAIELREPS